MKTSQEKIDRAIKLRTEQRLSLGEIKAITGISRSVLHRNLRNYPLSKEESKQRWKKQVVNKFQKTTDLSGKRFGRLLVLNRFYGDKKYKESQWCCLCDCGKNHIAVKSVLKNGNTKSCGCLRFKQTVELVNFKKIFIYYKCGAKKRNLQFELSFLDCINLFKSNCCYCGIEPFNEYKKHSDIFNQRIEKCLYNGIDRQDNSKGYTKDNCVACCKFCNFAKGTHSLDEFLWWIKEIKKV